MSSALDCQQPEIHPRLRQRRDQVVQCRIAKLGAASEGARTNLYRARQLLCDLGARLDHASVVRLFEDSDGIIEAIDRLDTGTLPDDADVVALVARMDRFKVSLMTLLDTAFPPLARDEAF